MHQQYDCGNYHQETGHKHKGAVVAYAYDSYENHSPGEGGPVLSFEFVVKGSTFATAHGDYNGDGEVVAHGTKQEALDCLKQRQLRLQQEVDDIKEFLVLAVATTKYEDLTPSEEENQDEEG